MPLTPKGKKIMKAMKKQYGEKKGEQVFYAMENSKKLTGVAAKRKHHEKKVKSYTKSHNERRHKTGLI